MTAPSAVSDNGLYAELFWCIESRPGTDGTEDPQSGQPSTKISSGPENPHRGQSTEVKILPQPGHRLAAALTSLPQF